MDDSTDGEHSAWRDHVDASFEYNASDGFSGAVGRDLADLPIPSWVLEDGFGEVGESTRAFIELDEEYEREYDSYDALADDGLGDMIASGSATPEVHTVDPEADTMVHLGSVRDKSYILGVPALSASVGRSIRARYGGKAKRSFSMPRPARGLLKLLVPR